jgi:cell division septation protein DedD
MANDERKRSQSGGASGWLATLGGALLLVAVGFGVGLVAGTAYEEPALVADHLALRTTEVALGPIDGESGDFEEFSGDVAAAPPLEAPEPAPTPLGTGSLNRPAAVAPQPPPASKPAAPASAAELASPGSGFAIQVGAFGSEAAAQQLAGELGKQGFRAYVASETGGARFKVRVGPLGSRSQAEQLALRLKRDHRLPTWIMAAKS